MTLAQAVQIAVVSNAGVTLLLAAPAILRSALDAARQVWAAVLRLRRRGGR